MDGSLFYKKKKRKENRSVDLSSLIDKCRYYYSTVCTQSLFFVQSGGNLNLLISSIKFSEHQKLYIKLSINNK